MDSAKTYNWKIVIIAQYHYTWAPEYTELIGDIEKSLLTSTVRFLVLTHNVPDSKSDPGTLVVKDFYNDLGEPVMKEKELEETDFYGGKAIERFLKEFVAPVEAKNISFMVWGHSAGLGYLTPKWGLPGLEINDPFLERFKEMFVRANIDGFTEEKAIAESDIIEVQDPWADVKELIPAMQFLMANGRKTPDPDALAALRFKVDANFFKVRDANELINSLAEEYPLISAETLAGWLGILQQNVNIFVASTCYCQMLESSYALSSRVKYMMAAQTTYPLFGFDYRTFFTAMQLIEPFSDEKLVSHIVKNFTKKYTDTYNKWAKLQDTEFEPELIDMVSISANDLDYCGSLLTVVDSLATFLIEKMNTEPDYIYTIVECRKECLDLIPKKQHKYGIIDLLHYVEKLNDKSGGVSSGELKRILGELQNIKKVCNKALYGAPSLYIPDPTNASASPQFLSIFHPPVDANDKLRFLYRVFYQKNPVLNPTVSNAWKWDEFVRKFAEKKLGF